MLEKLAQEYGERMTFLAPAWRSTLERTRMEANKLIPSGAVKWGLDDGEEIFSAYGVPYQPVTVLVTKSKKIADIVGGAGTEEQLRSQIEDLLADV